MKTKIRVLVGLIAAAGVILPLCATGSDVTTKVTGLPSAAHYGSRYTIKIEFTYTWTRNNDKPNEGLTVELYEDDITYWDRDSYGSKTLSAPSWAGNSTGTWSSSVTFNNVDLAGVGGWDDDLDDVLEIRVRFTPKSPLVDDDWDTSVFTRDAVPSIPAPMTIPTTDSDGNFEIGWGESLGWDDYELQEKRDAGAWNTVYTGNSRTRNMIGRTAGSTYYYRVRGVNSSSESDWQTGGNRVTIPKPQLTITAISPSGTQTKDWGESVPYSITVKDGNGNAVSGVTVGVSDDIRMLSTVTSATSGSGQTTYSTTVPSGTANGTYSLRFTANKAGYDSSSTQTRQVQVAHTEPRITLTVRNGPGASAPPVPNVVVVRRNTSNQVVGSPQTTDANGRVSWEVSAGTTWNFEAYNVNSTFGNGGNSPPFQAGYDQPEFWGDLPSVTAGGNGTEITRDLFRRMPVVVADQSYPWLDTVIVRRKNTGAVLAPGETVSPGTTLLFTVIVSNNWSGSLQGKGRVLLDRSKSSPFDSETTQMIEEGWKTIPGSGGTASFTNEWTPTVAGD